MTSVKNVSTIYDIRNFGRSHLPLLFFNSENDYRTGCRNVSAVNNNSTIQDYVHPDDQTQPTFESIQY